MKTSLALKRIYENHPFYSNRLNSDTLFQLPRSSAVLEGNLDYAIRFIEEYQLMDPALWAKFVAQFRDTDPKADDTDNGWRGEYWGKMMRGACFTYAYTGNEKLYDILTDTVRDMMTTQDSLGRISSYSVGHEYNGWDIWSRKYVLLGMQYFIEICHDKTLIQEITDCMCRQMDYMTETLGYEEDGKKLITKTSNFWLGMNSSSLLEPVVRLYNLTKNEKYLDFARYIVDCGVISTPDVSIFELAYRNELDPYEYPVTKAYEMMSCFEGLLEFYRVTGEEKWKTAVINFANRVRLSEISVIGSSGCTHELFDHTLVRQVNTEYNGVLQETCVTVTWMKFCFQLLGITGNSVYADEIEKSIYNALLGAINFDKNTANGNLPFDSYSPLLFNTRMRGIGGQKIMSDGSFYGCCACIGSAGTGLIGMFAAMLSDEGFNINLYTKSSFSIPTPSGKTIHVKLDTDYPLNGTVDIVFEDDCDTEVNVGLRIPEWSENTLLSVCGAAVDAVPGKYIYTKKRWRHGDYITLKLDMRCKLLKCTPDPKDQNSRYHVALRRGPLTLARDSRLPGNIESIVSFTPDAGGFVPCVPSDKADFRHFYCFEVTQTNGSRIIMVDYASAGRTWDENSMTTVWMPTKNYWSVDLLSPIRIISPNAWDSSDSTFWVKLNEDNLLGVNVSEGDIFTLEPVSDGLYKIRTKDGKYLDITADHSHITSSESGITWKISRYVQNRFRLFDNDGRALVGSNQPDKAPLITFSAPSYAPIQVFRFIQA